MTTYYTYCESPWGELLLTSNGTALTRLYLRPGERIGEGWVRDDNAAPFPAARRQLAEYFAGTRREFDLPLDSRGTPFQQEVWAELCRIPYGQTISYGELARRVGNPAAARAVGLANGRNPLAIIVPCHRVIGANGKLVGFGGGLDRKKILLDLEAGPSQPLQPSLLDVVNGGC